MMTESELKATLLDKYIFHGLTDLNTGFDVIGIRYHSAVEFRIILDRCEKLGIGIYGIEPWRNGAFYDVLTMEDFKAAPTDPSWYNFAFEEFESRGLKLHYSATYHIPEKVKEEFKKCAGQE